MGAVRAGLSLAGGTGARPVKILTLAQVIDGFLLACEARRLSPNTIRDYATTLRKFLAYVGDRPFAEITAEPVRAFLAHLADPQPRPGVVNQSPRPLGKKTILNYHVGLSALWTWAVAEGLAPTHILRQLEPPKPEQPAIAPFSEDDLRALLDAAGHTQPFARRGMRSGARVRATADRDRALIFLLLDTGMRASELCGLRLVDVDLRNRRAYIHGKGDKDRVLPFSAETGRTLWRYVAAERNDAKPGDPLFLSSTGIGLTRLTLLTLLKRLGQRAGVPDCHPHRFRHTFAIQFLRNGGNAYELQMMLGHATLDMVRRYLQLAQTDIEAAHREASPVMRWHLNGTRRAA